MDMDEMLEVWRPTVQRLSRFVAHDFPETDLEEVRAGLWEFICDNISLLNSPDQPGTVPALTRVAKELCWSQRKEQLQISAQYPYRPSDVRELLRYVFERETWSEAPVPDDAKSLKGNDGIEMCADISRAYASLSDLDRRAIFEAYGLDRLPEPKTPESRRLWKSIGRLVDALNSYGEVRATV